MKPSVPLFNIPIAVVLFALLLVLVHAYRGVLGAPQDLELLYRFAFLPARYQHSGFYPGGAGAKVWTVVTYALLHGGMQHLVINILWLICFGSALARRFGSIRFLAVLVLGSAGGAAAHFLAMPNDTAVLVGASAGVSAVMAGTLRFAFAPNGPLDTGWGKADAYRVKAPGIVAVLRNRRVFVFVAVWLALNLAFGLQELIAGDGGILIAWQSHIGGFLTGIVAFSIFDPKRDRVG